MQLTTVTLLAASGIALGKPAPWNNGPSSSTPAPQVIHPNGNTNKCLAAAYNGDNAPVILEDCSSGSASQLWTVTGGAFRIFGDKCLDDTDGARWNGKKMQIYTCVKDNTNQPWYLDGTKIGLSNTKKCLDNTDGKMNAGNPAQIWDCTGGQNQKWNVVNANTSPNIGPTPPGNGKAITPGKSSNVCLTAASNSDNAAVVVQNCDKSDSQQWSLDNGSLKIFGNKCLDVPNGSTVNGQKMQIYTCYPDDNKNQKFTVTPDNRIAWTNKGECLDLTDGNTAPWTRIQMWKCTDNDWYQEWNFSS